MSKLVKYPTSLPTIPIPDEINASEIVSHFAQYLRCFEVHDFKDDAVWRDTFALSGTSRTFYTPSTITAAWHEITKITKADSFVLQSPATDI